MEDQIAQAMPGAGTVLASAVSMHFLRRVFVLLGLWTAYLALFLGGTALLGPAVDPAALTPEEQASSGLFTLVVAAVDLAIFGFWARASRLSGWRLWLLGALVLYGVKTFSSQLETWYFITSAHVPPEMLPRLFMMTLPLCVIWPGLVARGLGPGGTPEPAPPLGYSRSSLALRVLVAGALLYPALFFLFGYQVAWTNAAVRAYYEGPAEALPLLAHLGQMFRQDPLVLPFEMARGLLWVGIGWLVWRTTRGPWWVGGLLYALMMAIVQNDLHLLPNPLMPAEVRMVHFVETASSNFLFAILAAAMLRPAGSSSRT